MNIRNERLGDIDEIHALTAAAFAPMPFSSQTEARIVDALRCDGDLTLSLVAEEEGEIVGHVAFSPVTIGGGGGGWFGLGPISVRPERQRQGIGKALIAKGLGLLAAQGAHGCCLIGDPDYYSQVGFKSDGRLSYGELDRRYVQRLIFIGPSPAGELKFAPAFDIEGQDPE